MVVGNECGAIVLGLEVSVDTSPLVVTTQCSCVGILLISSAVSISIEAWNHLKSLISRG